VLFDQVAELVSVHESLPLLDLVLLDILVQSLTVAYVLLLAEAFGLVQCLDHLEDCLIVERHHLIKVDPYQDGLD
jgi:hypothetical protein